MFASRPWLVFALNYSKTVVQGNNSREDSGIRKKGVLIIFTWCKTNKRVAGLRAVTYLSTRYHVLLRDRVLWAKQVPQPVLLNPLKLN